VASASLLGDGPIELDDEVYLDPAYQLRADDRHRAEQRAALTTP